MVYCKTAEEATACVDPKCVSEYHKTYKVGVVEESSYLRLGMYPFVRSVCTNGVKLVFQQTAQPQQYYACPEDGMPLFVPKGAIITVEEWLAEYPGMVILHVEVR